MAEGLEISRPQEASRLDALTLRTFYVVRHAKAGSGRDWTSDDRKRPLSKKGMKQAEGLVALLEPSPITAIFSSPYLRCVQTVEPLARKRKLETQESASLAEGHGLAGLNEFLTNQGLDDVVLSTHGDIVWELVEDLVHREVSNGGEGGYEKGSTWVLEVDEQGVPQRARYLPAP